MSDTARRQEGDRDSVRLTVRLPHDIVKALDHLPNRSEFVRDAVLARLAKVCPCCGGTGRAKPDKGPP